MAEDNAPSGSFIRVGVKGGGCSGLTYDMSFDHIQMDDDKEFEDNITNRKKENMIFSKIFFIF